MSNDNDGNQRGSDGTFLSNSAGNPNLNKLNREAQNAAGINHFDNAYTAQVKLGEHEHKRALSHISMGGSVWAAPIFLLLVFVVWVVVDDNAVSSIKQGTKALQENISYQSKLSAIEMAYKGQEFAPWGSYEKLMPSNHGKTLSLPPRELAAALQHAYFKPISDSERYLLRAAAWKCILENTKHCFNEAKAGSPEAILDAALEFLSIESDKGNPEAIADFGLFYIWLPSEDSGKFFDAWVRGQDTAYRSIDYLKLARAAWNTGLQKNPNATRAKKLLENSNSWLIKAFNS